MFFADIFSLFYISNNYFHYASVCVQLAIEMFKALAFAQYSTEKQVVPQQEAKHF